MSKNGTNKRWNPLEKKNCTPLEYILTKKGSNSKEYFRSKKENRAKAKLVRFSHQKKKSWWDLSSGAKIGHGKLGNLAGNYEPIERKQMWDAQRVRRNLRFSLRLFSTSLYIHTQLSNGPFLSSFHSSSRSKVSSSFSFFHSMSSCLVTFSFNLLDYHFPLHLYLMVDLINNCGA